ncbi:MAG: ECF transporter S component [Actinobacteria bacterium]|nr:ECF transporter S component [Actinomycetota bacterium]
MEKSLKKQYGWTTLDVVMTAVVGVVFAVLYWAYNQLFAFVFPFVSASPVTLQAFVGFWFIAGTVAACIIQKPGAAFLGELIAAIISMLLGSIWGVWVLISGLVQGAAAEAVFAAFRYKKYNYFVVTLSGLFTALVSFFFPESVTEGYLAYSIPIIIGMLVVRMISGAILGGALGKAITGWVAKTGVFKNFKISKEKE